MAKSLRYKELEVSATSEFGKVLSTNDNALIEKLYKQAIVNFKKNFKDFDVAQYSSEILNARYRS